MKPQQFIAKWKRAELSERSAAQQHFLDLCELLGQPKPAADPEKRGLSLSAPGTVPFFQPPVVFQRISDWHNEWYNPAQRAAIYRAGGHGLPAVSPGSTLV